MYPHVLPETIQVRERDLSAVPEYVERRGQRSRFPAGRRCRGERIWPQRDESPSGGLSPAISISERYDVLMEIEQYMDAVQKEEGPDQTDSEDRSGSEEEEEEEEEGQNEEEKDQEGLEVDDDDRGRDSVRDDQQQLDDIRGRREEDLGVRESSSAQPTNDSRAVFATSEESSEPLPVEESTSPRSHSRTSSLEEHVASLSLSQQGPDLMTDRAATQASKAHARQQRKYHSKRGAQRIGRPKGSKAKQDTRVKLDRGGMWD